tara:strand:+ start:19099 stop:19566 length:468 start_codon:yes stop_codon:yes gene_type:complete
MFDKRLEAIIIARSWIGTPWVIYGREPKKALDCIGFVACLGRALKFNIPEPILDGEDTYYAEGMGDGSLYLKYANLWGTANKEGEPKIGDILLFHPKSDIGWAGGLKVPSRGVFHNALYAGDTIIHANHDVVTEEPFTEEWDLQTTGIFSFKEYE